MKKHIPLLILTFALTISMVSAQSTVQDPGVRGGSPGAGGPLPGLTYTESFYFQRGKEAFLEVDGVAEGLGPTFNLDSCAGCHAQPAVGGSSPSENPQVAVATKNGAANYVPSFIRINGPVREARFIFKPDGTRDGGVHDLFTIAGRADAPGCVLPQEDFARQLFYGNVIFRVPTPVFGAGLIEQIPDSAILANLQSQSTARALMGIRGRPNRHGPGRVNTSGNDGSITRFGWKAQNKSLMIFAGEAYNVEQGVTNELFPSERRETPGCLFNPTPEDHTNFDGLVNTANDPKSISDSLSDVFKFAVFMRFLAPPVPAPSTSSTLNGQNIFGQIGCALCHTPTLMTGQSSSPALSNQPANLYSDLLLHNMGSRLADGIVQGSAGPDEFRTAPLWGLGQRIFFLHDGRTTDLYQAIQAHASPASLLYQASEANAVVRNFNALYPAQQQDLLNFLRSL